MMLIKDLSDRVSDIIQSLCVFNFQEGEQPSEGWEKLDLFETFQNQKISKHMKIRSLISFWAFYFSVTDNTSRNLQFPSSVTSVTESIDIFIVSLLSYPDGKSMGNVSLQSVRS